MKRAKNLILIVELPVSVSCEAEKRLTARLLAGARLYHAALGEALRCLDLMRESKDWQTARKLKGKERTQAFRSVVKKFEFTSASVSAFATHCKNGAGWKSHLSTNEAQRIEVANGGAIVLPTAKPSERLAC